MAGEKYVLHNKHVTPEDGVQMFSLDFSEKEEALLAIDAARRASLEYEDMVQDVDAQFYEKEGQCVIDVSTYKGNYADSYDEYLLTDKDGNQIDVTWDDVDLAMQNHKGLKRAYIPNINPNRVFIDGNKASVIVIWSAEKEDGAIIYCDADAVVDGDHPIVAPVSRENTKAIELHLGSSYHVYHDGFFDKMNGLDIARTVLPDKELIRQHIVPDGGGGGSAPLASIEMVYYFDRSEPKPEPKPDRAEEIMAHYMEKLREEVAERKIREIKQRAKKLEGMGAPVDIYEPDAEEDEVEEDAPELEY